MTTPTNRTIGLIDMVLYAAAMNFGIRWIATGAAAGPQSVPIWIVAALLFLLPLSRATLYLSEIFPEEGAVYAWTRATLGAYAGFLCGFIYWACNLPFFTGLLFFIINLLAEVLGGAAGLWLKTAIGTFITASALILSIGWLQARGLGTGKWISNLGAMAALSLLGFLIFAAGHDLSQGHLATDFVHLSWMPKWDANGAILLATIVFAYGGAEGVALLRNQAKGGMKQVTMALIIVGVFLALAYSIGTLSILSIVPQDQASRLSGLPQALEAALRHLGAAPIWQKLLLTALAISSLGGLGAWFGVAARLPFAAGLGDDLPKALGRTDPKSGAPVVAIWGQVGLVIAIAALAQFGSSLAGAYDFVVAMSVYAYTVPFVFLFLAFGRRLWVDKKSKRSDHVLFWVGLSITLLAIGCSFVPSPDSKQPLADMIKLCGAAMVLFLGGSLLYLWSRIRRKEP